VGRYVEGGVGGGNKGMGKTKMLPLEWDEGWL